MTAADDTTDDLLRSLERAGDDEGALLLMEALGPFLEEISLPGGDLLSPVVGRYPPARPGIGNEDGDHIKQGGQDMMGKREPRSVPLPVRFSPSEHEAVRLAAERSHEFVSSFIRRATMAAAERTLEATRERNQ